MEGFCLHVHATVKAGVRHSTAHAATPEFRGVPLREGRRMDGSPYWRGWFDDAATLVKAHERRVRCDMGDMEQCCAGDGYTP